MSIGHPFCTGILHDRFARRFYRRRLAGAGYEFASPGHARTSSLAEIPADLSDAELAAWPGMLSQEEIERRRGGVCAN